MSHRVEARGAAQRRALADQTARGGIDSATPEPHTYHVGRCVRCGVNWLDGDLPEVAECPAKADDEPIAATSATGEPTRATHGILES